MKVEKRKGSSAVSESVTEPVVLVVPSDSMGRGDVELGRILIQSFFHTLGEASPLPDVVVFLNTGVKLVAQDSTVLDDLRSLSDQGLQMLACGTCLGHFDLKDRVAVGEVSNMYTIAETLLQAGKVVNL
jgi:selenium metabolism protein YedF